MSEESVDISGLDKAAVLAVLYNAAAPHGLGFLQTEHAPEIMTVEDAHRSIEGRGHDHMAAVRKFLPFIPGPVLNFTYLYGRPLKIDISGDRASPQGYDDHHGEGAVAHAIGQLRATGLVCSDEVYAAHVQRLEREVREVLSSPKDYTALEREYLGKDNTARLIDLARRALGVRA